MLPFWKETYSLIKPFCAGMSEKLEYVEMYDEIQEDKIDHLQATFIYINLTNIILRIV